MKVCRPLHQLLALSPGASLLAALFAPPTHAAAPDTGFVRVTVQTDKGAVTVVTARRQYRFQPQGRTFYLARNGDDAGDGSRAHPWAGFAHALAQLQPGDLLYVRGGDYPTPFIISKSGEADRPIIISAYPGERVRIYQPAGWQREHIHQATVTLGAVKYVWLHGFEIEGCRGQQDAPDNDNYGQNGVTLSGGAGEGVRILNNVVSHAQHCGIKEMGHGGTHFLIEGNVIFDNGTNGLAHGIYIPSSEAVVRGNAIFRSSGYGIHLYSNPMKCEVYDNLCFENGAAGIIVSGPDNVIAHNVCFRNKWAGLVLFRGGCKRNRIANNIFADNERGQIAMDDGGGNPQYGAPSENALENNVVFPDQNWAQPPTVAGWCVGTLLSQVPVAPVNGSTYDVRQHPDSIARGAAHPVTLNGARGGSDAGLFPATQYQH